MSCHGGVVGKGRQRFLESFPTISCREGTGLGVSVPLTYGSVVAAAVGDYSDDVQYPLWTSGDGEDRVLAYSYQFVILPQVGMGLRENLSRNQETQWCCPPRSLSTFDPLT